MDYKHPKIQALIKEIVRVLEKNVKTPFKLYIFGSFATGRATYFSDLDTAIETKGELSDAQLRRIREEIENLKTLRKVDFVYLNRAPKSLKEVIKREGVRVYEFKG